VAAICAAYEGSDAPTACAIPDPADRPQLLGHAYPSSDPDVSADFCVRYFGA
jgi:hypothetical protein